MHEYSRSLSVELLKCGEAIVDFVMGYLYAERYRRASERAD